MSQTLREFTRNSVMNNDPQAKALTLGDLRPGQCFVYKNNTSPNNVYMRTDVENGAVYLPTGMHYRALSSENEVTIVNSVTINN